jgi:hypothetical protein
MGNNFLIGVAVVLSLVSYLALAHPLVLIRFMHGWMSLWSKLFGSNVMTHEQQNMIELARNDPASYEKKHPAQVGIVRTMGIIAILMVGASLCLLFN